MQKFVEFSIAEVFLDGKPPDDPLDFAWVLIRRRQRPFLLVPVTELGVRSSLYLYSAQRRRAKIWRAMLPFLLRTPLAAIFPRIHFRADKNSELMRFLSEQAGVPADQLPAPAIKFGGLESQKSRLVLLVSDKTRRPAKVVKIGLDEGGRAATDREADLLEKLPPNTLGGTRCTGRLKTGKLSAFATDYFPGDSPADDGGMEILFHSWINPGPAVPVESLDAWQDLDSRVALAEPAAWRALRPVLVGKPVRSTLHHGDFAPWNIRAVNSRNLQAFDWEGGTLHGIPGWDWFHFVVQTSILARRHSPERVAAEMEELLQSPRFEKYAADTGISSLAKPLVLAYLLRHRWVIQPLDGAEETMAVYRLLAARWEFAPQPSVPGPANRWLDARRQMSQAWGQLANVFWEPTLIANLDPTSFAKSKALWLLVMFCGLWIAAVANVQYFLANHLLLLPVYTIPCLVVTWKIGRRWGTAFACATAAVAPLISAVKDPAANHADLVCWNSLMRFIILQTCVFLTDRIHGKKDFFSQLKAPRRRPADVARNWAVLLASGLWFVAIAVADLYTGPRVIVLPLYLFPAMLLTLFLNLRWGAAAALLGALVASTDEYTTKFNANVIEVFGWNFPMRFLILFLVILLLDRISDGNVLFNSRNQPGGSKSGAS